VMVLLFYLLDYNRRAVGYFGLISLTSPKPTLNTPLTNLK